MSKTIEITAETIQKALESKPTSLTGLWKTLGGSGSVSGSASKRIRQAFTGIESILAQNKAEAAKGQVVPPKEKRGQKTEKKPAKTPKKSPVPRHPKNPFRPGSGYGLLLDIIAEAGTKGIGKEDLLKQYCKISGKDLTHAKYDLSVVNSGVPGCTKHRSMRDGVTIIRDMDNYRVRFE